MSTSRDGFLDRRIFIEQPKSGFRAGHDSVLLAAAVPAKPGDRVLELGAGAGVASLCLAARVAGCHILGVERDGDLVTLANANAYANGMQDRVSFIGGDAATAVPDGTGFDHVFFNPPFHPPGGQVSASAPRDSAMRDSGNALVAWTVHATTLLRPGGTVTLISRADRIDELRSHMRGRVERIQLRRRAGEEAIRVILRFAPDAPPAVMELPPLALHEKDGRPTPEAEAILRHGHGLRVD